MLLILLLFKKEVLALTKLNLKATDLFNVKQNLNNSIHEFQRIPIEVMNSLSNSMLQNYVKLTGFRPSFVTNKHRVLQNYVNLIGFRPKITNQNGVISLQNYVKNNLKYKEIEN